MSMNKKK